MARPDVKQPPPASAPVVPATVLHRLPVHPAAAIADTQAIEHAVLREVFGGERTLQSVAHSAACELERLRVIFGVGSSLDDHATYYGVCATCGQYLVITEYKSRDDVGARVMTAPERARCRAIETRERAAVLADDLADAEAL